MKYFFNYCFLLCDLCFDDYKMIKKKLLNLDCPQKVRHYLGVFLWKEKSSMIMHLSLNA